VDVVYWYSGIGYKRISAEDLVNGAVQLMQVVNQGTVVSSEETGEWLELTGPKTAVEFWYSLPIAHMADEGPTDYVTGERRGAFWGTADFVKGEIPAAVVPPIYIPPGTKPKLATCGPGPGKCPNGQICCSIFAPGGGIVGYCTTEEEGCGITKKVPEYSGKLEAESHWGALLAVAAFTAVMVFVSKTSTGARRR
jgi:hypothetical protein